MDNIYLNMILYIEYLNIKYPFLYYIYNNIIDLI